MHECNAMQLLETEEKKTKTKKQITMVTKEKQWSTRTKKTRQIMDTESHQLLDKGFQTYFYQEVW